jgi:hypothetical protein
VLDDDEHDDLQATAIDALTLFADQEVLSQDTELSERIEQLREQSPSEKVVRTADKFISRQSEQ